MNKDQVNGRVKTVKGAVKEAAGKVTGDIQQETEGKVTKELGKVQSKWGDLKDKLTKQFFRFDKGVGGFNFDT